MLAGEAYFARKSVLILHTQVKRKTQLTGRVHCTQVNWMREKLAESETGDTPHQMHIVIDQAEHKVLKI